LLTIALAACGGHRVSSRLLSGDDVPAGFRPLPLASDVARRWCGDGALSAPSPRRQRSEVLESTPDDGSQAVVSDTVLEFARGDAARFVAALRADERGCNRPKVLFANGLSIDGDHFSIDLPSGGDEQLVTDVRGAASGPALRTTCDGALARIVVRRGDVVAVIDDAVAGMQLDTGFRDRLAQRAAEQVVIGP
jgi:hypothetical protein